jgi:hypothetical protein
MAPEVVDRGLEGLHRHVERWREVGIITQDQGDRILQFEAAKDGALVTGGRRETPSRRLSLSAELVSYLGLVLVLASGAILVSRLWHGLEVWGRLSVGVLVAVVGFVAARAVLRFDEEGSTRLGWLFWLLGTGGLAMTIAVATDRVGGQRASWTMSVTGFAVVIVSVVLWRNLERPLQFLSAVLGVVVMVAGVVQFTHREPSALAIGLFAWTAGVVLGALALKNVRPALVAMLVGQGAAFMGSMAMIASEGRIAGFICGLSVAIAGVSIGLKKQEAPVVTLGVISFFVLVLRVLSYYLRGPGAMLAAFALGVVLVAVVIWRAAVSRARVGGDLHLMGSRRHARHH